MVIRRYHLKKDAVPEYVDADRFVQSQELVWRENKQTFSIARNHLMREFSSVAGYFLTGDEFMNMFSSDPGILYTPQSLVVGMANGALFFYRGDYTVRIGGHHLQEYSRLANFLNSDQQLHLYEIRGDVFGKQLQFFTFSHTPPNDSYIKAQPLAVQFDRHLKRFFS